MQENAHNNGLKIINNQKEITSPKLMGSKLLTIIRDARNNLEKEFISTAEFLDIGVHNITKQNAGFFKISINEEFIFGEEDEELISHENDNVSEYGGNAMLFYNNNMFNLSQSKFNTS